MTRTTKSRYQYTIYHSYFARHKPGYPRAIVVGHANTVVAAHEEDAWLQPQQVEQGGFAIATEEHGHFDVQSRFSRGVTFSPILQESPIEPASRLIRFSDLANLAYQLEAYYGRRPRRILVPENMPGAAIQTIQEWFPNAEIVRLTRYINPEYFSDALVIEPQSPCCTGNETCG